MFSAHVNRRRKPSQEVKNRVCFAGKNSELCIYDTYAAATRVPVSADQLMFCGLISGRKLIHSDPDGEVQPWSANESLILLPGTQVQVDCPDASPTQPTTCITLEIAKESINDVIERMVGINCEEIEPILVASENNPPLCKIDNSFQTQELLTRLVDYYAENHPDRDTLIRLGTYELITRLLRSQIRGHLLNYSTTSSPSNGLAAAINYIHENAAHALPMEELLKHCCMSRSRLYLQFKQYVGCTPCEFHTRLRLENATRLLKRGDTVTEVCYELGYAEPSHFSRQFRTFYGVSPRQYRNRFFGRTD